MLYKLPISIVMPESHHRAEDLVLPWLLLALEPSPGCSILVSFYRSRSGPPWAKVNTWIASMHTKDTDHGRACVFHKCFYL